MRLFWAAAGFAAGYVMGAKAGREGYEDLRRAAADVARHPAVADARAALTELAGNVVELVAARAGITVEEDDSRGAIVAGPQARSVTPKN